MDDESSISNHSMDHLCQTGNAKTSMAKIAGKQALEKFQTLLKDYRWWVSEFHFFFVVSVAFDEFLFNMNVPIP